MKRAVFSAVFMLFFWVGQLHADALFLTMPLESRGMALGNSGVATARGTNAIRYNPAGLGFAVGMEGEVTHVLMGELSGSSAQFTYPFAEFFSMGLSFAMMRLNETFTEVVDFQPTGRELGLNDIEVGVSGGYQVMKNLSVGTTLRYFRFQLGPEIAQSVGADLGAIYQFNIPWKRAGYKQWAAGLTVKNLGPGVSFFGGGDSEPQPLAVATGLGYRGFKYATPSLSYEYSTYDSSSFGIGVDIMPQWYVSPKLGLRQTFSGLVFSAGAGLGYGKSYRVNAIFGSEVGGAQTRNTFASILVQKRGFESKPKVKPVGTGDKITIDRMGTLYKPHVLVPFKSGYRAEKIQGIVLSVESASGYKQRDMRLRRIAIQPEDEPYLKQMGLDRKTEMHLTGRKMSLWLNFVSLPVDDQVGWWDSFAAVVEGEAPFEVLTGSNLTNLNKNRNAPLRVEWRLDINYVKGKTSSEIKTALVELYSNKLVLGKSFTVYEEDHPFMIWQEVSQFYAAYLKNVEGFYKYQMILRKEGEQ